MIEISYVNLKNTKLEQNRLTIPNHVFDCSEYRSYASAGLYEEAKSK